MQPLSEKHRRWVVVALSILGVLIIFFGFKRLNNMAKAPFFTSNVPLTTELTEQEQQKEILSAKDTDEDGLNDYDELYIYNTSPYLEDSDSDGISDKDEVESGKDPNCPGQKDCYGAQLQVEEGDFEAITVPQNNVIEEEKTILKDTLPSTLSPEDIRDILFESGFTEEDLSDLSNEDLISIYEESLANF